MKKRITPNLFAKSKKVVNLDILRKKHAKLAQRVERRFNVTKLVADIVKDVKEKRLEYGERDFRSYVSLAITQDLLKKICNKEQYKTAIAINASILRVDPMLLSLKNGLVGKKEVEKLYSDAAKIAEGFGNPKIAMAIKRNFIEKFGKRALTFAVNPEETNTIKSIASGVTSGSSQMLLNLLGEKKIAVLDSLLDKVFTEVLKEID